MKNLMQLISILLLSQLCFSQIVYKTDWKSEATIKVYFTNWKSESGSK